MADKTSPRGNSGDFAKKVQRQLSRGKEKVMQRLGKSMETRDDLFEHCLQNFSDQQTDGNRIYKDLRVYVNAVRDMREASRRLSQSLFDVYESDWAGEEDLGAIVEGEDLLWNDYEVKLLDQAVRTMESYVSQFPDVRDKIAKRGRKLVDYDSSLHQLEALQTAKKRDDVKISKAKEEMNTAKVIYEGINNDLKEELPVLFDSRIGCYVAVFSAVSNLRDIFHKEMSTLNQDLQNVIKELQAQHPDKAFAVKGLSRYGSLKRRSLISPKAWKASFSEVHRSFSPRTSQRFSFRSPEKPPHSTLSREGSMLRGSLVESRELDVGSYQSEVHSPSAQEDAVESASGSELKSGDNNNQVEGEKAVKEEEPKPPVESENKGDGKKDLPSASSSEQNNSYESDSLELQLSAADNGPLHIEETDDSPVTLETPKLNRLENGDASGLNSDAKDLSIPQKDVPAEKEISSNSKNTMNQTAPT
ncbi:bridging integrator 2a isoform X1 [Haplochromis burtoni]|uniref:bridging integrator 2a isoform X1 n=1 Tax=Haplochromis burtoni TaxID=8153 RepID=UPI0003BD0886|nr:bridging integrator 2a isoform X1 [Haplochromis burtoni]XP_014188052.1 bridging integrator 2a isoform X1 [Haplochromis burtoni]